jgi:hypothetical protein
MEVQKRILDRVREIITDTKKDGELSWMLIHYYGHNHSYFNEFNGCAKIINYCELNAGALWPGGIPSINSLKNRGQMGYYWIGHLLKIVRGLL